MATAFEAVRALVERNGCKLITLVTGREDEHMQHGVLVAYRPSDKTYISWRWTQEDGREGGLYLGYYDVPKEETPSTTMERLTRCAEGWYDVKVYDRNGTVLVTGFPAFDGLTRSDLD